MSSIPAAFLCHHCSSSLPETELAEGWCGSCGKRLPSTFKAAVQPGGAAVAIVPPTSDTVNPWGVGLLAVGAVALSMALAFAVIVFTV